VTPSSPRRDERKNTMQPPDSAPRYVSMPVAFWTVWEWWTKAEQCFDWLGQDRLVFLKREAEALAEMCRERGLPTVEVPGKAGSPTGLAHTLAFPEPILRER